MEIRNLASTNTNKQLKDDIVINKKKSEVNDDINLKKEHPSNSINDKFEGKKHSSKTEVQQSINLIDESKMEDILGKMKNSFKSDLDEIRNSKGTSRDNALLGFQNKIDNMSSKELKSARDILVKEMANPKNKDDELLGSLLNRVNKELDSRGGINSHFGGLHKIEPNIKDFGKLLNKLDDNGDDSIKSKMGDIIKSKKGGLKDAIEPITKDTKIGKPQHEPAKLNQIYDLGLEDTVNHKIDK